MENVVIFGTGGHAKVVTDILLRQKIYKPVAFLSLNESLTTFLGLPHFHQSILPQKNFKTGVVAIGDNFIRSQVVEFIKTHIPDFKFITAVHPSAQIAGDVVLSDGTVVMANCVVNSGSNIGSHAILNTGSVVDHDCKIEQFASIAPGCVLGGNVVVGEFSAISLGANVIHGKKIGQHTVIGAGALVLEDVEGFKVAYGSPCREIRSRTQGEKYL
ncbi:NeuD/PglB/VioB family sugar acetyltransferase [bacterium]|nr:NeuD/PglB/VioB family sugar acetyltransferase [bacterium]